MLIYLVKFGHRFEQNCSIKKNHFNVTCLQFSRVKTALTVCMNLHYEKGKIRVFLEFF